MLLSFLALSFFFLFHLVSGQIGANHFRSSVPVSPGQYLLGINNLYAMNSR
jgi:hypothetical protein